MQFLHLKDSLNQRGNQLTLAPCMNAQKNKLLVEFL